MSVKSSIGRLDQEKVVLVISAAMFLIFAMTLNGFATIPNILSLFQSVSIIGALGLGMAIVIIGRGIDLSMIAVMVMPVAWSFMQIADGMPVSMAFGFAILIAVGLGLLNGWLVAFVEVPSIFATLATGMILFGGMQYIKVQSDIIQLPPVLEWFNTVMTRTTLGVPNSMVFLLVLSAIVWLFLRFTRQGRFIYAIGDNPMAARTTGLPVRQIVVLQYVLAAVLALFVGNVLAAMVDSANTRLFYSNMMYDVILVVVLGGVGLGGGKGRISNVLAGTALIGILVNGMTILDVSYMVQNLVKASVLLLALVVDSLINPRDEQTSQQGDI
ncbi:ABC transporter permease [Celeribacter litoreus]|uniref:ABC transporter permease n=1 Tax=Celeribacter litoreus TaxID=2876714 RepID=UPI001CCDA292|nr:ABC transporter permease [Celeribacter litoreus]MCA0043401.1 ABC transporter permease [Celeribacter litoreus]